MAPAAYGQTEPAVLRCRIPAPGTPPVVGPPPPPSATDPPPLCPPPVPTNPTEAPPADLTGRCRQRSRLTGEARNR